MLDIAYPSGLYYTASGRCTSIACPVNPAPAPVMPDQNSVQSTSKGWMPSVTKVAVPASNFSVGNSGRKAVCLHIVEGSAGSALHEFQRASQKSSHFVVSKTGTIWQCVSVIDSAYANGLSWSNTYRCWFDPEKNLLKAPNPTPPWQGLTPPINPNMQTISIEREGYYRDVPTDQQHAAVVRILRYVHETFPILIPEWIPLQTLIGHCHIGPKHRANCPGPHVDYAALAAAANGEPDAPITKKYRAKPRYISQRSEGGAPYAGELQPGEEIVADKWYTTNGGMVHLADGRGFVLLSDLEPV